MPSRKPRTVTPDGEEIRLRLSEKGWSQTQLLKIIKANREKDAAELPKGSDHQVLDPSHTPMSAAVNGKPVVGAFLGEIARALGVGYASLLADEQEITFVLGGESSATWNRAKEGELLNRFKEIVISDLLSQVREKGGDPATLDMVQAAIAMLTIGHVTHRGPGSMKVTIKVSRETAALIDEAFEEGKLAPLGVTALEGPLEQKVESALVSRLLSAASLLFSVASYWVGWLTVPGGITAVASAYTAYRRKGGYLLAGLPMLAATSAMTAWVVRPKPQQHAAQIAAVEQRPATTELAFAGEVTFTLHASQEMKDRVARDAVRAKALINDPNAPIEDIQEALRNLGKVQPEVDNDNYYIPEGDQRLIVKVRGEPVFDRLVSVPPNSKVQCAVTKAPDGRYAVKFTPDIAAQ